MKAQSIDLSAERFCCAVRVLRLKSSIFISFTVLIVFTFDEIHAAAATITPLGSFNGANGNDPVGNLMLAGSTLYGLASNGGPHNDGVVYSIPVSGGTPTILGSFNGANGAGPEGNLILSGSTLYGMTGAGGANNLGTVFSIPLSGGSPTTVLSFDGNNGASPFDNSLIVSGANLYGVTYKGGANNIGAIFKIPIGGGAPTVITSLDGSTGRPQGGLTLVGSTLYGTSTLGGLGFGTVYKVPVSGGPATVLAAFSGGPGGYSPLAGVVANGSTLYGTTGFGGMGLSYGTVFSVPMSGGPITTLAQFNGTNGYEPQADMMLFGSTLYGTTTDGGIHGQGNIFSIPITGGAITNVASFSNLDPNNSTGAAPLGGLILSGSTFYGATTQGGPFPPGTTGDGVVYALTGVGVPEPPTFALCGVGILGLLALGFRRRIGATSHLAAK